jgi:signal transduction histidine kinase
MRDMRVPMLRSIGTRMSRMINDLLDLTRARLAGGIPIRLERVDLGPVVNAIVDECRLAWPNRVFELSFSGGIVADVDADRLAQAAVNLVQNAAVHGTGGSPVRIRLDASGDDVVFTVDNDGVVGAAELKHLFDPFARAPQAEGKRARSPGLGLGLFIVDQIVRAHGGVTEAISADGCTTFRFSVPRERPPGAPRPTPVAPKKKPFVDGTTGVGL